MNDPRNALIGYQQFGSEMVELEKRVRNLDALGSELADLARHAIGPAPFNLRLTPAQAERMDAAVKAWDDRG